MARFNLDDYETVHQMLIRLYTDYPSARVITENITPENVSDRYEFKAELFLDQLSPIPVATGHAYEVIGSTNVNTTSAMENCETSAIGRAINNSVLVLGKPNKNRPSREEMEKVQRMTPVTYSADQQDSAQKAVEQLKDITDLEELRNLYQGAKDADLLLIPCGAMTLNGHIGLRKKELEAQA
jgi:hypothetical protein